VFDAAQKFGRRHNGNSLKGMQCQQILIAGNNSIGSSINGKRQELIVFRIAASGDNGMDSNVHCFHCDGIDKLPTCLERRVTIKPRIEKFALNSANVASETNTV
jgi:hypothetical protein